MPGNDQVLLVLPDLEALDVLINSNAIDVQTQSGHTYNETEDECQHANNKQETGKTDKCKINTTGIPKFK